MIRLSRAPRLVLVVLAIWLFFFLALDSLVDDSPTMDEQNHVARGLAFLRTGDPRLSLEHPPLINAISALPLLLLSDLQIPTDHPSWEQPQGWYAFAEQLYWIYNQDVTRMMFLSRMPIVFLTLAAGLVGFLFARQMWGRESAMLAFLFLIYDPNIIAHGRYSTTDLGGTTFLFLSAFLLWRLWSRDSSRWGGLFASGLGIGLALSSKFSNLVFMPIFLLLSLLPVYGGKWSWQKAGRRLLQVCVSGLIALLVIWVVYAFEWGQFRFQSEELLTFNKASGPMPTFWAGIEQILRISSGGRPSFLLGQTSVDGWWYYFPIVFLVKTPALTVMLFVVGCVVLLKNRASRSKAAFLLLPSVGFLGVAMQSELNIGYRHLLPVLPFLYVLSSGIVTLVKSEKGEVSPRKGIVHVLVYLALLVTIILDLLIHPHYPSFFNYLSGGPANGHNIIVDSNIDWGQDLIRLKTWIDENQVDEVNLSWFGTAKPEYYGIRYKPLPGLPQNFSLWWDPPYDTRQPEPGIYAISVSNLWEIPLKEKTVFQWFRRREPDHRIGYSIHIYEIGQ